MIQQSEIENWLGEAGYKCKTEEAGSGILWRILAEPVAEGYSFYIFSAGPKGDRLEIHHGLGVAEPHREALRRLSPQEFNEFKFQLTRDLLLSRALYKIDSEGGQNVKRVLIVGRIWEDDLDRTSFFSVFQAVYDAALLATIHVRRAAGEEI